MEYAITKEYSWDIKIDSYMVGPDSLLRPSYLLKLQQEAGERQFGEGGLGFEGLLKEGLVFVLTRLNTVILRAPRVNETVRLLTWHRQPKGAQFFRCYQFLENEGESLVESVSAFSLVDPVEHKLLGRRFLTALGFRAWTARWSIAPIRPVSGCRRSCTLRGHIR